MGGGWTSLPLFTLGALVPVLPFVVTADGGAVIAAAALSGAALFALGAAITRLTGVNPIVSGLRQVAFGTIAAVITYGIGAAVGTGLR